MRPISEATGRVTGKTCSRKYIALGRIVNCWNEIVGPELARKAQPAKLRYSARNSKNGVVGKTPEAVLEVAAASADATLLHYQKDLILERINQIFGDGWITDIKFVASVANNAVRTPRKAKKPLTQKEKTYLSGVLEAVQDMEIRERLSSLGESILMETEQQS